MNQLHEAAMPPAYAAFVRSLMKDMGSEVGNLILGAVGLAGEAGELLDCVKKTWAYGMPLDESNLLEECGDALFYLQAVCNERGWSLSDLMRSNIEKLQKRYPTGAYTDMAAVERADKLVPADGC